MKGNFMDNYLNKSKKMQSPATQQIHNIPISRPGPVASAAITQEDIARRAYEIYLRQGGQTEQNWLQAERELRSKKPEAAMQR
jgi:hypothetical protein